MPLRLITEAKGDDYAIQDSVRCDIESLLIRQAEEEDAIIFAEIAKRVEEERLDREKIKDDRFNADGSMKFSNLILPSRPKKERRVLKF